MILRRILALHNRETNLAARVRIRATVSVYCACASACTVLYVLRCVSDLTVRPSGEVLAHTETHLHSRKLSHFLFFFSCGFRSEQLLNGHSSSETGHWEAQRGLARVSALPNTHTHTHGRQAHTHTPRHTPGKAWFSLGSESEM